MHSQILTLGNKCFFFIILVVILKTFISPCSLAMFYVIALAGAHKRVINQLREQLAMVGLLSLPNRTLTMLDHNFDYQNLMCYFVSQEGRDKRFLIQKLCQAQRLSALNSPVSRSQPRRSSSRSSPSYHTSFSNNFNESVFLAHSPPDSSTHVWAQGLILKTRYKTGQMDWSWKMFELISWMFFFYCENNLGASMDLLVLFFQCSFVDNLIIMKLLRGHSV